MTILYISTIFYGKKKGPKAIVYDRTVPHGGHIISDTILVPYCFPRICSLQTVTVERSLNLYKRLRLCQSARYM